MGNKEVFIVRCDSCPVGFRSNKNQVYGFAENHERDNEGHHCYIDIEED